MKWSRTVAAQASVAEVPSEQLDGFAVRRTISSMIPRALIAGELFNRTGTLRCNETFECAQPMRVIGVTKVGIASRLCSHDFSRECIRPFDLGE